MAHGLLSGAGEQRTVSRGLATDAPVLSSGSIGSCFAALVLKRKSPELDRALDVPFSVPTVKSKVISIVFFSCQFPVASEKEH